MPENIHAVGFYKEMARLYFSADIVLLPSFHEGLGYAILEGAAMGKPQIGSDLAGIRCAIRNGVTGLLFNVGCEESFFSCLQKLLHDESLRATLGKASRDLMLEKFSRREIVAAYVEFYRQIFIEFDQRDTEG
jgi:glycosyltransferase involved in cell wall biosynthesis